MTRKKVMQAVDYTNEDSRYSAISDGIPLRFFSGSPKEVNAEINQKKKDRFPACIMFLPVEESSTGGVVTSPLTLSVVAVFDNKKLVATAYNGTIPFLRQTSKILADNLKRSGLSFQEIKFTEVVNWSEKEKEMQLSEPTDAVILKLEARRYAHEC